LAVFADATVQRLCEISREMVTLVAAAQDEVRKVDTGFWRALLPCMFTGGVQTKDMLESFDRIKESFHSPDTGISCMSKVHSRYNATDAVTALEYLVGETQTTPT
jgi:hypothetical protein